MPQTEELTPSDIWQPDAEGDKIECIVKEIDAEGQFGLRVLVEVPELEKELWTPSHKALQVRLNKAKVGDRLIITYTGEEPPAVKGHNPTRLYKVERVIEG